MLDPYRMVLFNSIACLILGVGIITYRKVFPQKKIRLPVLLLLLSGLVVLSILRKGTYESGLLTENVQAAIAFYRALTDGNIFPVWSGTSLVGYGNPVFLFLYPLPFYVSSLFHFLGMTFLASVKLVLALSFITSGMTMYLWIKDELGEKEAFVASILYLFAPYHLIELHFRVAIGVTMSFIFLPLVFYGFKKIIDKSTLGYIILSSCSLAGVLLSHPSVFVAFSPLLGVYVLYKLAEKKWKLKLFIMTGSGFLGGALLSAFYWLPSLAEGKYIAGLKNNERIVDFKAWWEYLASPSDFGLLFQGHHGETHFLIGYPHLIVIAASCILLWYFRKTLMRKFLFVLLIAFIITYFLMLSFTQPLWDHPPVRFITNAWRLLAVTTFITSVMGAIIVKNLPGILSKLQRLSKKSNKKIMYGVRFLSLDMIIILFCFFTIGSTILNWGNRKTTPLNYTQIKKDWTRLPAATDPSIWTIWVKPDASWTKVAPDSSLQLISGKGKIQQLSRTNSNHVYLLKITSNALIRENTLYFPGWNVLVNNHPYPFSYTSGQYSGLITVQLKPGLYKLEVRLDPSPTRSLAYMMTGLWLVVVAIYSLFYGIIKVSYFFKKNYA